MDFLFLSRRANKKMMELLVLMFSLLVHDIYQYRMPIL